MYKKVMSQTHDFNLKNKLFGPVETLGCLDSNAAQSRIMNVENN